jgi:hypothetical protein
MGEAGTGERRVHPTISTQEYQQGALLQGFPMILITGLVFHLQQKYSAAFFDNREVYDACSQRRGFANFRDFQGARVSNSL